MATKTAEKLLKVLNFPSLTHSLTPPTHTHPFSILGGTPQHSCRPAPGEGAAQLCAVSDKVQGQR